jgi:hypothetical protein
MKTFYTAAFLLFIAVSFSAKKEIFQENKLVATFKGVTDEDFYKFEDQENKEYLFYDIHEDLEIDLYDEDLIGKKYKITWKTKQIDVLDEYGEETGEKTTVKTIINIEA